MSETSVVSTKKRRSLFGELSTYNFDDMDCIVNYPNNYHEQLANERHNWEQISQQFLQPLELQKQRIKSFKLTDDDLDKIAPKYRQLLLEMPNFEQFKTLTEQFLIKQVILRDIKEDRERCLKRIDHILME